LLQAPLTRGGKSVLLRTVRGCCPMATRAGLGVGAASGILLGFAATTSDRTSDAQQGAAFATGMRAAGPQQAMNVELGVAMSSHLRGHAAGESAAPAGSPLSSAALCCGLIGTGGIVAQAATRRASKPSGRRQGRIVAAAAGVTGNTEGSPRAASPAQLKATGVDAPPRLVTDVNPLEGPEGTYNVGIDFKGWLQSANEEIEDLNLRVQGTLPAWLRGSLVHAGPAKFEFGENEFVDWVDGQAMLYRVRINGDGKAEYRNQWLDTSNHRAHREAGRIAVRETCSRPHLPFIWDRIKYMFEPPNNENGNLHISQFANSRLCSMSVGSALVEFELSGMTTFGKIPFNDVLSDGNILIFHAEPHLDHVTGEWFTCAIQLVIDKENFKLTPEYVVYSIKPDQPKELGAELKRNLITRISTEHPSPVHTIGLTKKYIVMIQIPYPLNWDGMLNAEGRWLLTGEYEGNLNDYNTWEPHRPTLIRLIDRETGEQLPPFETDPFFFFHCINSFEEDNCVILDVVCYNEPPVGFPLRQARSGDVEDWRGGGGEVRRFKMDLASGEITSSGWPNNCFDEPKVNPKVDGIRHKYSFGVIDDNGMLRLTKQDHDTQEVFKWLGQDVSRELPWQPVFIPEPYSEKEDAGVLMSFVRDQPTGDTYCVVINTETMQDVAKIYFPKGHHIPLHGHGTFLQGQF